MNDESQPWAIVFAAMLLSLPTARAQDAYVPNQGTNDIKIFDVLDPSDTVTLGTGNQPDEGVATLDARYVFVSNRVDHNISVYDAVTRTEVDTDGIVTQGRSRMR